MTDCLPLRSAGLTRLALVAGTALRERLGSASVCSASSALRAWVALMRLAATMVLSVQGAQAQTPPAVQQVKYMLWDASQLPAYRQCAADFERRHPTLRIKLMQAGWNDYWTSISMGFISNTAPDVFVNHLSKYPEFAQHQLLLDLAPLMARDGLAGDPYGPGLLQAWSRAGRQLGLPKDWDTVALLVNLAHARQQGVRLQELQTLDWNPRDGGRFERVVRRLTVDTQGRNALHPDFDKSKVRVYGYQTPGSGGMAGQTAWSHFAVSNGFQFQDAPWQTPLHYDSPALAETLDYLAGLSVKGLSAPAERLQSLGASALFASQKVALIPEGSWMIAYYRHNAPFEHAWVPLPVGPTGRRASMRIGTADSIWAGTRVREAAWQWVKYLASSDCQSTVARRGVVFPALRGTERLSLQAHREQGVDSQAFLTMAQAQTFLTPMAEHGAEVDAILTRTIDAVLLGHSRAGPALQEANGRVQRLFTP